VWTCPSCPAEVQAGTANWNDLETQLTIIQLGLIVIILKYRKHSAASTVLGTDRKYTGNTASPPAYYRPDLIASRGLYPRIEQTTHIDSGGTMDELAKSDYFRNQATSLKKMMPIMADWSLISRYQKMIWENYRSMWAGYDLFQTFVRLAPTYLSQVINPWSFSLIQFTKELKGSPELEYKILTEVDGYGAQLGTIIDWVEVLSRYLKIAELPDEDKFKYMKFKKLAEDIGRAKGY